MKNNSIKTLKSGRNYKLDNLKDRLKKYPFEIATQLMPKNLNKCLNFELGREKLKEFYNLDFDEQRRRVQTIGREVYNFSERTLKTLLKTRREVFVPKEKRAISYFEGPIWVEGLNGVTPPLFCGNVAEMMNFSRKNSNILVIGSGEGYSTAFFAEYTGNMANLYGIEIDEDILNRSRDKLHKEGYSNVELMLGNGIDGWKNDKKFDYIWTTLAVKEVPNNWLNTLKDGGNIGIFRKLTKKEFKEVKDFSWFPFETFEKYSERWWEQTCLEILHKNNKGNVKVKDRFYNVFNAPFLDDEYGEKININWSERYGKIQRSLIDFLS